MSLARAATAGELTKFRSSDQWSKLYVAVHKPTAVFAARANQTFTTTDDVTSITFDTVTTGAYTAIVPGMTMYVGTSAGAFDLGMVRVRKAATSSVIYIGRTSEIRWDDNVYLTVVNEFSLWTRHWLVADETTVYMDYDIVHTTQNSLFDPVPVIGPDAVLWLTGATITFSPSAASSWVLGSTISGYSWTASGSSSSSGMTTATPSIVYNAAGQYVVSCTVTASNGKSFTGYRNVFVYSESSMPLLAVVEGCNGDYESGGWSFTVSAYENAALSDIRDGTKVILFARDFYGSAEGSIGPQTGYENIVCAGFINGESIDHNAERGRVRFTAHGPQFRLNTETAFPCGLKQVQSGGSVDWLHVNELTVDKALMNILHWRSTATAVLDVYKSGDTRQAAAFTPPVGTLWSQLLYVASRILAKPLCNRYGQLVVEPDLQVTPIANRASIPTVMSIMAGDWDNETGVGIERRPLASSAVIEVSGTGDTEDEVFFSRAPGLIFRRFGRQEVRDQLLLASQSECNDAAKLLLSQLNNQFPNVSIPLSMNMRLVDICPRQYVDLTIASTSNVRGISWTNKKLVPRKVAIKFSSDGGYITTTLECEAETTGENEPEGQTVIPPVPGIINQPPQPGLPGFPMRPFTGGRFSIPPVVVTPLPIDLPPDPICALSAEANGPFGINARGVLLDNSSDTLKSLFVSGGSAIARGTGAANPTTLVLQCKFEEIIGDLWVETPTATWMEVYLTDVRGVRVSQGTVSGTGQQRTVIFYPPSNLRFYGVEVIMSSFAGGLTASNIVFNDPVNGFWLDDADLLSHVQSLTQLPNGSLFYTCTTKINMWNTPYYNYIHNTISFDISSSGVLEMEGDMRPLSGILLSSRFGWYGAQWTDVDGTVRDLGPAAPWQPQYDEDFQGKGTANPLVRSPLTILQHGGTGYNSGFIWKVYIPYSYAQLITIYVRAWLRRIASKRLTIYSAQIYNICP